MGRFWRLLTATLVIMTALLWKIPACAKFYGYGAVREVMKAYTIIGAWKMDKISSEHFSVRFMPDKRAEAEMVLETAEHFYYPVTGDFGFSPRGRIPLILYSSREELNKSFGWEANESAMGVYWAGAIRVLSPGVWAGEENPEQIREIFASSGPVAHELTHLIVDYLTGGNYPRWFTEGVAQYEEYKLTGFTFDDAAGSLRQPLYSMSELDSGFDSLPNQALAYKESFAAVLYIDRCYGEDTIYELIHELGQGNDLSVALEKVLKVDLRQFETQWQEWYVPNVAGS
ncbi:MAG: hypothetical protein A4E55_00869 [Pelotomaculum sp. PtaU1.Bin035]|nr:MAG: hypothetical protein A4E55_00869 [Pelotomaculum sp. PtaU1.Bin035]